MSNTAVKPANAESTWGEAPWEDRKPLILIKKALAYASAFLWFVIRDSWLVGNERLPIRPGFPGISREPVLKEPCDAQNRVSRLCRISGPDGVKVYSQTEIPWIRLDRWDDG